MDSRLSAIVNGRADKKIQAIYVLCTFLYYAIFLIFCIFLYKGESLGENRYGGFTFQHTAISNLGNPDLNPQAWWVFSIGMIGTGILLLPQLRYIYVHIRTDAPKSAKMMVLLLILTPLGMIGAGIINEHFLFVVHYIFGALVYAGLGLAAIYAFFFFILRMVRKKPWPTLWQFVLLYSFVLAACGFLFSQLALLGQPGFDDIDFLEWVMLVTLIGWFIGVHLILPGSGKEKKIET